MTQKQVIHIVNSTIAKMSIAILIVNAIILTAGCLLTGIVVTWVKLGVLLLWYLAAVAVVYIPSRFLAGRIGQRLEEQYDNKGEFRHSSHTV